MRFQKVAMSSPSYHTRKSANHKVTTAHNVCECVHSTAWRLWSRLSGSMRCTAGEADSLFLVQLARILLQTVRLMQPKQSNPTPSPSQCRLFIRFNILVLVKIETRAETIPLA